MAALLDEIAERLLKIEQNQTEQQAKGIVEPLNIISVTTVQQVITPPQRKPWFSVSAVNDGPENCWIIVNTEKSSTTPYLLYPDETFEVDMGAALIDDLLVWCDSGTATLRIRGVR